MEEAEFWISMDNLKKTKVQINAGALASRRNDWQEPFIHALREEAHGNVTEAALMCNVSRAAVYRELKRDADFAARVSEAREVGEWALLPKAEATFMSRTFKGTLTPVFREAKQWRKDAENLASWDGTLQDAWRVAISDENFLGWAIKPPPDSYLLRMLASLDPQKWGNKPAAAEDDFVTGMVSAMRREALAAGGDPGQITAEVVKSLFREFATQAATGPARDAGTGEQDD